VGRRPVIAITIQVFNIRHRVLTEATERWSNISSELASSERPERSSTDGRDCFPSPTGHDPPSHNHCPLVCVALDSRRRQTTKWFPMPPENIVPRRDTECRPAMHCQFGFGGVGSMGDNIRKKATSDTLPKPGKVNSGTIFLLLRFYLLMFMYR